MGRAAAELMVELDARVPLVSSPILIGDRVWNITAVQNQDALLDAANELEHFPYGFLLWESAVGLARYLTANRGRIERRSVLELGAGVGLAGLIAQSLGARVSQTDHQKGALTLARHNANQGGVAGIEQFLADWRTWTHRGRYDVILGADITYERAMHFYLEQIFQQNLAPGGVVVLSDPGRPQSLEFMAALESRGWQIGMETEVVSLVENEREGRPVEVAILTLRRTTSG